MKAAARWVIASLLAFGLFPLSTAAQAVQTATAPIPATGSKFGGNVVTIAGLEFSTTGTDEITTTELNASNSVSPTPIPGVGSRDGDDGGNIRICTSDCPGITSITPNVVSTAGGQLIKVDGRQLAIGTGVTLGGVMVELLSSTANGFTFIMPALPVQVLDRLLTSNGVPFTVTAVPIVEYMNIKITVVAAAAASVAPGNPETAIPIAPKSWSAIGVASKFAPGSAVINAAVRNEVSLMIRKYARFATTIQCTGFTMGPTVLRVDAKLSRDRAAAVCGLIKQLRPKLTVISAIGRQEPRLGGEIRGVEVQFKR